MSNKITGKEYPLDKIFSSDFEYHIPVYQRPYAWTKDETGKLFDDLYDFFCTRSAENYFLGSIVMIKDGEAILVKAGSIIAPTITEGFQRGYLDLRHELVQNGIIVDNVFITDYTFDSVSAAAAVILGRSANGRKEWTKLDGRTIAQVGH